MKTFWVEYTDAGATQYWPDVYSDFVFKFLYWSESDGILVAGPRRLSRHNMLLQVAKEQNLCPQRKPDGAGTCSSTLKEVKDWSSLDLEVETPDELKPLIQQVLFG